MSEGPQDGARVIDGLRRHPLGAALLEAAEARGGAWLVGGAVRDLLLGREPAELDVVVDGDATAFARELGRRLGVEPVVHERFGTATVTTDGARIDLAGARAESYAAPGSLPDVRPGDADEDLRRRDFTVNAIAVRLDGDHAARAASHAFEDLEQGRLRVLHPQSFADDPTRLLRLARYAARLGFEVEPQTAELAARALEQGALATVSGARIGAELRLALAEPDAAAALATLERHGVLRALDPRLRFDERVAVEALELTPPDTRGGLVALAACALDFADPAAAPTHAMPAPLPLRELLDGLEFPAADRDAVLAAVFGARALARELWRADRPSAVRRAVAGRRAEAVVLAGALAGTGLPAPDAAVAQENARRWLSELRHVRLEINGQDLLDAGVEAGPEIGRRLAAALDLRLDGELGDGRDAELRAALGA